MGIYETFAAFGFVEQQAVYYTCVGLRVVNDHILCGSEGVDDRDHTLITEVEKESIGLADESGELSFELFVNHGLAAHHTGTHRIGHTVLFGRLSVYGHHLGVGGETQIVVETPRKHLFTAEFHARSYGTFQFGKEK